MCRFAKFVLVSTTLSLHSVKSVTAADVPKRPGLRIRSACVYGQLTFGLPDFSRDVAHPLLLLLLQISLLLLLLHPLLLLLLQISLLLLTFGI